MGVETVNGSGRSTCSRSRWNRLCNLDWQRRQTRNSWYRLDSRRPRFPRLLWRVSGTKSWLFDSNWLLLNVGIRTGHSKTLISRDGPKYDFVAVRMHIIMSSYHSARSPPAAMYENETSRSQDLRHFSRGTRELLLKNAHSSWDSLDKADSEAYGFVGGVWVVRCARNRVLEEEARNWVPRCDSPCSSSRSDRNGLLHMRSVTPWISRKGLTEFQSQRQENIIVLSRILEV